MTPSVPPLARAALAALLLAPAARAAAQQQAHEHEHASTASTASADARTADLHMRMTEPRAAASGDAERIAQLTDAVRRGAARYADVRAAGRDGYRLLIAGDTSAGAVLHYTNLWRAGREGRRGLRPDEPGSLLYERQRDGSLRLVGAMFTAPADASLEELDRRVPLAFARWHLHTNLCLPRPVWSKREWARTANGRPLFGPASPVATREACEQAGGAFKPSVFGWMVHANVVDETDPAAVWGARGHAHRMTPAVEPAPGEPAPGAAGH